MRAGLFAGAVVLRQRTAVRPRLGRTRERRDHAGAAAGGELHPYPVGRHPPRPAGALYRRGSAAGAELDDGRLPHVALCRRPCGDTLHQRTAGRLPDTGRVGQPFPVVREGRPLLPEHARHPPLFRRALRPASSAPIGGEQPLGSGSDSRFITETRRRPSASATPSGGRADGSIRGNAGLSADARGA